MLKDFENVFISKNNLLLKNFPANKCRFPDRYDNDILKYIYYYFLIIITVKADIYKNFNYFHIDQVMNL